MPLLLIKPSLLIICLSLLCACVGNPVDDSKAKRKHAAQINQYPPEEVQKENLILAQVYQQYRDWKDVPYRWGGLSRKGLDCSGLVYLVFRNQFGVQLPRTTVDQVKRGRHVKRSRLQAGDLLFFKTGKNLNHVGIYLENNQFLHVSTKKGVKISSLENNYWSKRYRQSRRVL